MTDPTITERMTRLVAECVADTLAAIGDVYASDPHRRMDGTEVAAEMYLRAAARRDPDGGWTK